MPSQRIRRIGLAAVAAILVAVGLLALFWQNVARAAVVGAVAWTTGLHVRAAHLEVHRDRLVAGGLHVENGAHEPIADIGNLTLQYSIRDFFPGSARMFGLVGFDVENAHVIVTRHADGTLNIPLKQQVASGPSTAPYAFIGRVRNASVDVYDFTQGSSPARHLIVSNIVADLNVATNARTRYRVGLDYVEDGRRYPFVGNGDVDAGSGAGLQRWRIARLPVARIVDVALDTPALRMTRGWLRDVDARIVSLPGEDGTLVAHASATANLERAQIDLGGLAKPLRDVHGPIAVFGDGLLLQGVEATLASMPIRVGGGVFGLSAPQAKIAVSGEGDARTLRTAVMQTAKLPLSGPLQLNVALEGAAAKPSILIAVRSPRIAYGALAVERTTGLVAFDAQEADVVDLRTRYGRIDLFGYGRLRSHPQRNGFEMLAGFDAPAGALPYANALAPMPLHAALVAAGDRPARLDTRGVVFGESNAKRVAGTFELSSSGVGTIGPLRVDAPNQSLYAIAAVNHPRSKVDAVVRTRNLQLASGAVAALPGLTLPAQPPFAATVDSAVAGSFDRSRVSLSGFADLRGVRTPSADVARAHVVFGRTGRMPLTLALDASGIGAFGAVATALVSYENGTIRVHDAAAATRGTFADARGSIADVQRGAPRYDLRANVHSVDVATLAALAAPRTAGLVEGSAEARLHVGGAGTSPSVSGTLALPEGAVNGLAFHDLRTSIEGSAAALALRGGDVGVGSTDVAFDGVVGASAQRLSVTSSNVDLADFNDFFDAGDVLGGQGRVRADVALAGGAVVSTSGNVALRDAKLRSFDIGAANAAWHAVGNRVATTLAFGGPFGYVSAAGTVALNGSVDMTAHARNVDLSRWLPMAGFVEPVTGIAQADLTAVGRYPDFDSNLRARVVNASVGRLPVTLLTVAAATRNGRGRVIDSTLIVPNGRVAGSGTFGLHPNDELDLTFRATTPDVAALGTTLTGKKYDAAGALDTTLRVAGTRLHPQITDDFMLANARYGKFDVPRATGRVRVDERSVQVASSEIDLRKGRLMMRASVPISLAPFQIDPHNRPIGASVIADDVEASNVAELLPNGTKFAGRVDGRVALSGTVRAPRLGGTMTFAKGSFSGPQERVPITDATAQLAFSGTSVRLQNARANAGGGTLVADGNATLADVANLKRASMALHLRANNARLDLPQYIKGRLNADVQLARAAGSRPTLSGTVAVDSARIPMTALYNPKASNTTITPPDLGVDMHVLVNRDVRVQSPNVDVGAEGSLHVTGSLAAPQLAGRFTSTGGTVTFFREFTIQDATVSFDPSSGIIPDVDAAATTFVTNPDTNVALHVTGPATHLNLGLASDPSYDREQILGLLVNAQSLGAVRGVQTSGSSPFSTSSAISNLAAGEVNTLFTRNLLEPLSVAIGGSLGLQNLQITNDVQSGLGINAVKAFGKNVNFVFADTFNEPRRESWSLQAHPSDRTQFEVTTYTSQGTALFGYQPFLVEQLDTANLATMPLDTGSNGIDVKLQRKFP